jgi:hypothetical protein
MAQHKPTFSEILQKTSAQNSENLMAKARLANRLAKLLNGKNRRKAYNIKSQTLCGLIKSLPHNVNVIKDIKLTEFVVVELKTEQSGLHLPIENLQTLHTY